MPRSKSYSESERKRSCGNGSIFSNMLPAGASSSSSQCTLQCSLSRAASKGVASPSQMDRRRIHLRFLLESLLPPATVEAGTEGGRGHNRGLRHLPVVRLYFRRTTTHMVTTIGLSGLGMTTTTRCPRSRTCIPSGGCRSSRSLPSTPILDQDVQCGNVEVRMGSAPAEALRQPRQCHHCTATLPRRGPRIRWSLMPLRSRQVQSMRSLSVTLRTRTSVIQRSARTTCSI